MMELTKRQSDGNAIHGNSHHHNNSDHHNGIGTSNNNNTTDNNNSNASNGSSGIGSGHLSSFQKTSSLTIGGDCDDDDDDGTRIMMMNGEDEKLLPDNNSFENGGGGDDDEGGFQDEYTISTSNNTNDGIEPPPQKVGGGGAWNLQDWLFPPHLPRSCQLLRRENIAIPACYLLVGLLSGLLGPLINVYPLDLGATEAQYTVLSSIRGLPASFKLLFGFLSDNVPLYGYRRKSYMFLGWLMAALSMMTLLLTTDLTLLDDDDEGAEGDEAAAAANDDENIQDDDNTVTKTTQIASLRAPPNAPSIPFLAAIILLFGIGFWMADVMGDSVVAEKAKLEPFHSRGSIQSSCYAYRFFGLMCAAPFSTAIYHWWGPYYVFLLLALLPLSIVPLIVQLGEVQHAPVASTRDQCAEIWTTVCSRAVWQPLGFVFVYNIFQVQNSAWKEFLKTTLDFTTGQLNLIYVATCVLLYLGILVYKYGMMQWSWRMVYIITTLLNGFFSLLQVLLITGHTFGLPNFWFALGDDAFGEFIHGIQFLPTTIMMVHLCPAGSEGASYAMFTTVHNAALNLNSALSTWVLTFWHVGKEYLAAGELSGMINLTYLTTALQVFPICLVFLLPQTKDHLMALKTQTLGTSSVGGAIFLIVTFSSVLYAIYIGVMNICFPGWMGES
jgi:BT1 family